MDVVNLTKALMRAQKAFPPIERDAENPHFKARYTTLDRLIEKTRPALVENGLAAIQLFEEAGDQTVLVTMLMHESGERIESRLALRVDRSNMQGLGSAATYARRYALAAILGVASDQDDDGQVASIANHARELAGRAKPPRPPAQNPAPAAAENPPPAAPICPPVEAWQKRIQAAETPEALATFLTKAENFAPLRNELELWYTVVVDTGAWLEHKCKKQEWKAADCQVLHQRLRGLVDEIETLKQGQEAFG